LKPLQIAALSLGAAALLATAPAMAVYRCESKGQVSYQDAPCPGGRQVETIETNPRDAEAARKRAATERKLLKQIQSDKQREDAAAAKESSAAAKRSAAKEKKCAGLARRRQWTMEDAAVARGKAIEPAKRKARRADEVFQQECRKA
jgi:hypothetical protein